MTKKLKTLLTLTTTCCALYAGECQAMNAAATDHEETLKAGLSHTGDRFLFANISQIDEREVERGRTAGQHTDIVEGSKRINILEKMVKSKSGANARLLKIVEDLRADLARVPSIDPGVVAELTTYKERVDVLEREMAEYKSVFTVRGDAHTALSERLAQLQADHASKQQEFEAHLLGLKHVLASRDAESDGERTSRQAREKAEREEKERVEREKAESAARELEIALLAEKEKSWNELTAEEQNEMAQDHSFDEKGAPVSIENALKAAKAAFLAH